MIFVYKNDVWCKVVFSSVVLYERLAIRFYRLFIDCLTGERK